MSARLYSDTSPKNLELSGLQKGLVLVWRGVEVVEEGAGFGAPVMLGSKGRPVFSLDASLREVGDGIFVKQFIMNGVSRKRLLGGPRVDGIYNLFHGVFSTLYTRASLGPSLLGWLMRLRDAMHLETFFEKTDCIGVVDVTYNLKGDLVSIGADFSKLEMKDCKTLVLLNEQGGHFFDNYADDSGLVIKGSRIEPWMQVRANSASFISNSREVRFTLKRQDHSTLIRGREVVPGRLSWSGLSYIINPTLKRFSYSILLEDR